jgi:serine/threonine-protein phosphatase 6 regulatory ankyrin repeat subunit A/serine/threonine-protein phosphatase 6 regulatory ankyrin repeat subunit B
MDPSQYLPAEFPMQPAEHRLPPRRVAWASGKRRVDGPDSALHVKKQKIGEQGRDDGSDLVRALNPHNLSFPASWRVDEKVGVQGGVGKGVTAKEESGKQLAAESAEAKDEARYDRNKLAGKQVEVGNKGGLLDEMVNDDRTGAPGPSEEQVAEVNLKEPRKLSKKEKKHERRVKFKHETMKATWPLHWAAANNDLAMLRAALSEDRTNARSLNLFGMAPLHYAAQKGHRDAAELLLDCKADIEQIDNLGRTPLYYAALTLSRKGRKKYDVEMLRWLVQQGANCVVPRACHNISKTAVLIIQELSPQAAEVPDGTGDVIEAPDKQADEESHVSLNIVSHKKTEEKRIEQKEKRPKLKTTWPLHWAAENNNLAMVEAALLEGWASVDDIDDLGRTPLHCAAARNDFDVARLLLSNNASLEQTDKCGRMPLHLAAGKKKCMRFMRWLVQQGANVKAPITGYTSEKAVERLLGLAHESNSTKVDLPGAQIDKLERDHEAANKATVKEKREKYKETIKERNDDQRTKWPLHWAAANNHLAMVETALSDGLTSVDQLDNSGRAPLHCAINCGRIEMVELLLNCKADIEQTDKLGRTSLHLAAEKKDLGILRSIVQQGASVNTPLTGHTTNKGIRLILEVLQESCSTNIDFMSAQRQELEKIQAALNESESNVAVLASNLITTNRDLKEGSDALSALRSQQTESMATLTSAETARDKFHNDLLAARKELKSAKMALREAEMVKRKENISKARNYHVGMKEASSGITVKLEKQEGEHQQEVSTLAAAHAQELEAAQDKATELEDGLACTVCLDHPKTVCLFPCSHVCLCESCAEGWSDPCPICRAVVTMQRKVFFA